VVGLLYRRHRAGRWQEEDRSPATPAVDATIELLIENNAFFLRAHLDVSIPGVDREVAQELVDAAHGICPYSKATRGNIDVALTVAQEK